MIPEKVFVYLDEPVKYTGEPIVIKIDNLPDLTGEDKCVAIISDGIYIKHEPLRKTE